MHLRAETVIDWEIDRVANLWQILHEEKQTRDQIKCYFSWKFEFLLQLLHRASVLVRDLKIWTVVLQGIQQCFQDIRFGHPFLKCYNFCNML